MSRDRFEKVLGFAIISVAIHATPEGLGSLPNVLGRTEVTLELVDDIFGTASVVAWNFVLDGGV